MTLRAKEYPASALEHTHRFAAVHYQVTPTSPDEWNYTEEMRDLSTDIGSDARIVADSRRGL